LGGGAPDTARAKADAILDEVLDGLTTDPAPPVSTASAGPTLVESPEDLDAFQVWAMEQEWSDGLPVLPPTEARVAKILGRRAANGPIAARLGVAGGPNALGNGHRANAVIGRAVRLVLQNVGGARPGREDRATLGHPGKFSYCLAENEAQSPWEPLHVERGFPRDASTVTVCGSEGPHNVNDHGSMAAETLMAAIAGTAATTGSNNIYLAGDPLAIGRAHV